MGAPMRGARFDKTLPINTTIPGIQTRNPTSTTNAPANIASSTGSNSGGGGIPSGMKPSGMKPSSGRNASSNDLPPPPPPEDFTQIMKDSVQLWFAYIPCVATELAGLPRNPSKHSREYFNTKKVENEAILRRFKFGGGPLGCECATLGGMGIPALLSYFFLCVVTESC